MYRYNCIIFQTGAGQARAATAAEDALHLLGRVRAPGQELIQNLNCLGYIACLIKT